MKCWIVDRLEEWADGLNPGRIPEALAVPCCADDELSHVAPSGDTLKRFYCLASIVRAGIEFNASKRLEAVGMNPQIRVGDAHRAGDRVSQALQCPATLASSDMHEANPPRRQGFPAGIA